MLSGKKLLQDLQRYGGGLENGGGNGKGALGWLTRTAIPYGEGGGGEGEGGGGVGEGGGMRESLKFRFQRAYRQCSTSCPRRIFTTTSI